MSVETKLSARALPGQTWKVKSNPITKKYGVSTYRGVKGDDRASPGELCTVEERRWSGVTDGVPWENSGLWIVFSRGRENSVDCVDLSDFLIVRKAP